MSSKDNKKISKTETAAKGLYKKFKEGNFVLNVKDARSPFDRSKVKSNDDKESTNSVSTRKRSGIHGALKTTVKNLSTANYTSKNDEAVVLPKEAKTGVTLPETRSLNKIAKDIEESSKYQAYLMNKVTVYFPALNICGTISAIANNIAFGENTTKKKKMVYKKMKTYLKYLYGKGTFLITHASIIKNKEIIQPDELDVTYPASSMADEESFVKFVKDFYAKINDVEYMKYNGYMDGNLSEESCEKIDKFLTAKCTTTSYDSYKNYSVVPMDKTKILDLDSIIPLAFYVESIKNLTFVGVPEEHKIIKSKKTKTDDDEDEDDDKPKKEEIVNNYKFTQNAFDFSDIKSKDYGKSKSDVLSKFRKLTSKEVEIYDSISRTLRYSEIIGFKVNSNVFNGKKTVTNQGMVVDKIVSALRAKLLLKGDGSPMVLKDQKKQQTFDYIFGESDPKKRRYLTVDAFNTEKNTGLTITNANVSSHHHLFKDTLTSSEVEVLRDLLSDTSSDFSSTESKLIIVKALKHCLVVKNNFFDKMPESKDKKKGKKTKDKKVIRSFKKDLLASILKHIFETGLNLSISEYKYSTDNSKKNVNNKDSNYSDDEGDEDDDEDESVNGSDAEEEE